MSDETSETAACGEVAVREEVDDVVRVLESTPENVLMHLRNIFGCGGLEADPTAKELLAVRTVGRRTARRRLKRFNLDVIISAGYQVNSRRGGSGKWPPAPCTACRK